MKAGGFSLAFEREGFRTIAFCEIDDYARRTLIKNFGAVIADADDNEPAQPQGSKRDQRRRAGDRDKEATSIAHAQRRDRRQNEQGQVAPEGTWVAPGLYRDIRTLDGTQFRGIDVVCGGFPCQSFSQAGKRRGKKDDRYLWPEMLRIISQARPAWVFGENVAGFLSLVEWDRALEVDTEGNAVGQIGSVANRMGRTVATEAVEALEAIGYEVQIFVVPACGVDAPHRRDRVWIIAQRIDTDAAQQCLDGPGDTGTRRRNEFADGSSIIAHPGRQLLQRRSGESAQGPTERGAQPGICKLDVRLPSGLARPAVWPEEDPQVPRIAKGVKDRVNKLRALGNSVVVPLVQVFARAIREALDSQVS